MRILLLVLLCCSPFIWADSNSEQNWNFKVLVNDREVGSHEFSVITDAEGLSVSSTMALDFKILLIKRITYQHQATERWEGGCLTQASSQTKRQSKKTSLQASTLGSTLVVKNEKDDQVLEGCVRSFTYWDPELLRGERLLNVETGEYIPVTISSRISALDNITHMTIAGPKINIQLQYDGAGDWLSLQTTLKTGAELKYQRTN